MRTKPILVFIDGPSPSEEDRNLFDRLNADQFVNAALVSGRIIPHTLAVAVDMDIVPDGYITEVAEEVLIPVAPVQNPSAPVAAPQPKTSLGIQAGDEPALPKILVKPAFGIKAG